MVHLKAWLRVCLMGTVGFSLQASAAQEIRYTVDPTQSRFLVHVYRSGLLGRFGHDHTIAVQQYQGTVTVTEGTIGPATLTITAQAASLKPMDEDNEVDRRKIEATMRHEVLEIDRYAEIRFRSIAIVIDRQRMPESDAFIIGMLDLHGVSRLIVIQGRVGLDDKSLRATGAFTINQTDYGIKPVSVMGGLVKVKNTLTLTFDFIARRVPG